MRCFFTRQFNFLRKCLLQIINSTNPVLMNYRTYVHFYNSNVQYRLERKYVRKVRAILLSILYRMYVLGSGENLASESQERTKRCKNGRD